MFHPPSICPWVGCPHLSSGEMKWNRKGFMCWPKPSCSTFMYLKGRGKHFWDDFIYKAEPPAWIITLRGLWFSLEVQRRSIYKKLWILSENIQKQGFCILCCAKWVLSSDVCHWWPLGTFISECCYFFHHPNLRHSFEDLVFLVLIAPGCTWLWN